MYSEWSSLADEIRSDYSSNEVLGVYPADSGKEVVSIVLKSLTSESSHPVTLTSHQQVKWTMEVIGCGLALPLSEHVLIHHCVDIYETWLSAIHKQEDSIPTPLKETPDEYARTIFQQLCHVFSPASQAASSNLSTSSSVVQLQLDNQTLLCSRVLRLFHVITQPSTKMNPDTWECFLSCLLRIANIMLAPPSEPNSLSTELKGLPIHVLFEAWLRACVVCFPRPQLWKSLQELCCHWRHHGTLASEWTKLVYTLTYQVINNLYTSKFLSNIEPSRERLDSYFNKIVTDMPHDVLIQTWYRMLHTLGNPVEVSYPHIIANLPAFKKSSENGGAGGGQRHNKVQPLPPAEANLAALPRIYQELMRGVASLVYLFLGQDISWNRWEETDGSEEEGRRKVKRHDSKDSGRGPLVAPQGTRSKGTKSQWYTSLPGTPKTPPASSHTHQSSLRHKVSHMDNLLALMGEVPKPKGNTLLHLFGSWLFQAAIWPIEEDSTNQRRKSQVTLVSSLTDLNHPPSITPCKSRDPEFVLRYEKGRAEAFGALCSIFSSQPSGESFLPVYLAKFYHALILGLSYSSEASNGHILTEIILHSSGLLRKNLKGINLLVPHFIDALQLILPRQSPPFKWVVNLAELRHSSIDLLLSMFSLPLHFLSQPLPNIFAFIPCEVDTSCMVVAQQNQTASTQQDKDLQAPPTFLSLKDHIVQLIVDGIIHEKETINKQMLIHALNVIILDIVTYENALNKMESDRRAEDSESLKGHIHQSSTSIHSTSHLNLSSGFTPSLLVNRAMHICRTCLLPPEGDVPVQVSMAALELLSSLAQLQFENIDHTDTRAAVLLVSEYIKSQAVKDLPRHNRDLHTSIVAAFSTLLVWVQTHPYLLGSKKSLSSVMSVIELGVSGCFSTDSEGKSIYKGEKKAHPISGRVKEIAEFMLYCVMERSSFPSPCGAESSSSLLSEEDILARLPPDRREQSKFQYFLMDNSVLLGLLEEPFTSQQTAGHHQPPLPTVTAVIRSPSGRHVWSMQLRHHPRSQEPSTDHQHSAPRPVPKPHPPVPKSSVKRRPWPDEVEQQPAIKVDSSIPLLEDTLTDQTRAFHHKMLELTKQQIETEEAIHKELFQKLESLPYPNPATAAEPPKVQESFATARLFLNHLSLLDIEGVMEMPTSRVQPLALLNSSHPNFSNSLATLDHLPCRFCDTVFVLHCKEGLTKPEDILAAQSSLSNKSSEFLEFLHGLGWIVDPATHPGFSGKIRPLKTEDSTRPVGISAQIPTRPFPYYTDAMTEVAFVMPVLHPSSSNSSTSLRSAESSDSGQDNMSAQIQVPLPLINIPSHPSPTSQMSVPGPLPPPPTHSLATPSPSNKDYVNIDAFSSGKDTVGSGVCESSVVAEGFSTYPGSQLRKYTRNEPLGSSMGSDTPRKKWVVPQDCAAMVVWLEKFEDHLSFPSEVLSGLLHGVNLSGFGSHKIPQGMRKSLPIIFIHMMSSGLYQIVTKTSGGRVDAIAGPLIDGMVVSRRSLSVLVRQTAINMCSRHRMESDGFSPPHMKRKRKLEEMANSYKLPLTVAEYYTNLFTDQSS